jgi:hypothetical protein
VNRLQLCQALARESGTVAGYDQPTTTLGQTGRLGRIVGWIDQAWRAIQVARSDWLWMQDEFQADTVAGTGTYDGATLVDSRFGDWLFDARDVESGLTCWPKDVGQNEEGNLRFVEWPRFRQMTVGDPEGARPWAFTVDPRNRLRLFPVPDKVYTLRGVYRKSPQTLTVDLDEPELPERHHDLIWRAALRSLFAFDENASTQVTLQGLIEVEEFGALVRDQTGFARMGGSWI